MDSWWLLGPVDCCHKLVPIGSKEIKTKNGGLYCSSIGSGNWLGYVGWIHPRFVQILEHGSPGQKRNRKWNQNCQLYQQSWYFWKTVISGNGSHGQKRNQSGNRNCQIYQQTWYFWKMPISENGSHGQKRNRMGNLNCQKCNKIQCFVFRPQTGTGWWWLRFTMSSARGIDM